MNLGVVLSVLGERETGTARLVEAVTAWDLCLAIVDSGWPQERAAGEQFGDDERRPSLRHDLRRLGNGTDLAVVHGAMIPRIAGAVAPDSGLTAGPCQPISAHASSGVRRRSPEDPKEDAMRTRTLTRTLALAVMLSCAAAAQASADAIGDWNQKAVVFGEARQMAPPQAERVMALVHLAMFDALYSIDRRSRH
jgi:hypothetical protein